MAYYVLTVSFDLHITANNATQAEERAKRVMDALTIDFNPPIRANWLGDMEPSEYILRED